MSNMLEEKSENAKSYFETIGNEMEYYLFFKVSNSYLILFSAIKETVSNRND